MNIHTKKGYVITEAAIFMPIFILGILSLCFIIKYGIIYSAASQIAFDDTRAIMRDMYVSQITSPQKRELEERLSREQPKLSNIDAGIMMPAIGFKSADQVRTFKLTFDVKLPKTLLLNTGMHSELNLTFRPFIGKNNAASSFDYPDKCEDYEEVWVFPRAGERYHKITCQYVTSSPKQMILTAGVKLQYSPCKLCAANSLPNGAVVYCFTASGNCYHQANCSLVEKYVISMDIDDAVSKGYTPCKVCGGH